MLLENRYIAAKEEHLNGMQENTVWKLWKIAMLRRSMINIAGAGIKNKVINTLFKNSWALHRSELHFSKKSFNELWIEQHRN